MLKEERMVPPYSHAHNVARGIVDIERLPEAAQGSYSDFFLCSGSRLMRLDVSAGAVWQKIGSIIGNEGVDC